MLASVLIVLWMVFSDLVLWCNRPVRNRSRCPCVLRVWTDSVILILWWMDLFSVSCLCAVGGSLSSCLVSVSMLSVLCCSLSWSGVRLVVCVLCPD